MLKIRTLRLTIISLPGQLHRGDLHDEDDGEPTWPVGEALIHALEYVSDGQNLRTFELCFPGSLKLANATRLLRAEGREGFVESDPDYGDLMDEITHGTPYPEFFSELQPRVLKALSKLKGLREFVCPDLPYMWAASSRVMRDLKSHIESQKDESESQNGVQVQDWTLDYYESDDNDESI